MEYTEGHIVEELGLKAYKKGFYPEWLSKTSSLHQEGEYPLHEAAEIVYKELKEGIDGG